MSEDRLTIGDYPLAEKRPEIVRGKRGKGLEEITLDAVLDDRVALEDLRITARALRQQAEIARAAGRETLAENFERAAELVEVPQDTIMHVYELLRPGRAESKDTIVAAARELREQYGAKIMAAFVEEAAAVYERRGLFKKRF
jgi:propanediol dehydratase small subunit